MKSGLDEQNVLAFTDDHIFADTDPEGTEYLAITRTFYMKEIPSDFPGYGFDSAVYTLFVRVFNVKGRDNLKVVIEDDKGNKLSDNAGRFTSNGIPVFLNTYRADGSIQLNAEKTVVGHALAANQFSFELYDGTTLLQTIQNGTGAMTGTNTYTGNVIFDSINYKLSDIGIKTYRIVEKNTGMPGYTYDEAEYIVSVKIDDNDNGTLTSPIQSIQKKVGTTISEASSINFTNTYTTTDTTLQIAAEKTLTGQTLADRQFRYSLTLKGDGMQPDSLVEVVTNNADGLVSFAPITYTQADTGNTFIYTMKEVSDAKPGYEYDNTVYTITVKVIDDGDGTLHTEVIITKPGDGNETITAESIVFSNAYVAKGSVQFTARKELIGQKLSDKQFSLILADEEGRIVQKAYNNGEGNIVFNQVFFNQDQLGEHRYSIYEYSENKEGFTYDNTIYLITVIVTDNEDGTLNTEFSIRKGDGSSEMDVTDMTFVNEYHAAVAPSSPVTGDFSTTFSYALLAVLSLAAFVLTKSKRIIRYKS